MTGFDFHLPTKILFGRGRVRDIGSHIPAEAVLAHLAPAVRKVPESINRMAYAAMCRFRFMNIGHS